METATIPSSSQASMADTIAIVRRFFLYLVLPGAAVFLFVLLLAFVLPSIYRSSGILLVEQQEIPQDMVRSTITTYVTQRFSAIQRRVLTRATKLDLIEKYDLYPEDSDRVPSELLLQQFDSDLTIEPLSIEVVDPRSGRPTQATSAFELAFDNASPTKAYAVLNELISLLLEENARNRAEQARGTSAFLAEEARRLEDELERKGAQFADFKERNVNTLPELLNLNYRLLEREEAALEDAKQQLGTLDQQLVFLQSELDQVNPFEMLVGSDGQRLLGPEDRLKALEAELAAVRGRYSEDHPDIVRLRSEIRALRSRVGGGYVDPSSRAMREELQSQRSELARLRGRYADDHPEVELLEAVIRQLEGALAQGGAQGTDGVRAPSNPAYVSLKARLDSVRVQRESLIERVDDIEERIARYERRIVQTPQIEKDYAVLQQDYENTRAKYQEVRARQLEAELSESLEQERKGERLVLIEPPLVPERPVSPNRPLLVGLGLVLAAVVGFGAVFVAHSLDGSVFGTRSIESLVGAAPIGLIPVQYTPEELQLRRRRLIQGVAAAAVGFVLLLVLVHFFVRGLDDIWYALLVRIGV